MSATSSSESSEEETVTNVIPNYGSTIDHDQYDQFNKLDFTSKGQPTIPQNDADSSDADHPQTMTTKTPLLPSTRVPSSEGRRKSTFTVQLFHLFVPLLLTIIVISSTLSTRKPAHVVLLQSKVPHRDTESRSMSNQSKTLRLFSLNVFVRPVLIGTNDYKDERLELLCPRLAGYDVVCLQELFWTAGNRKANFLKALSEDGFHFSASAPAPSISSFFRFPPKLIDAGLSIVSRTPILESDHIIFDKATLASIDYIVGKGVLYARIQIFENDPSHCIHVFTTHLQANNGLDESYFIKIRQEQLEQMVEFVTTKTADDPNGAIVLAGDFNVNARKGSDDSSSSQEYLDAIAILRKIRPNVRLQDVLYDANNDTHPVTSAGGLDGRSQKNERLDYIFTDGLAENDTNTKIKGEVIEDSVKVDPMLTNDNENFRTLSDHYAVMADIKVTKL